MDEEDHHLLAIWAADCAERVLSVFESHHEDGRPREAIEAVRAWVRGKLRVSEARTFAFAAHAAAREVNDPQAKAAARAAGHAAATAHVPRHANYTASYATKASADANAEKEWQLPCIPKHLEPILNLRPV